MRGLLTISLLSISIICFGQVDKYRQLYFAAGADIGIQTFYDFTKTADEKIPLNKAYKGVAIAMYAELANEVSKKFEYFNKGKELIEDAVKKDASNPEIRFLRFSVQAEVPWIVGYSSNLKEDADIVVNALQKGSINAKDDFWRKAITFMLKSGELNTVNETKLKKYQS